MCSARCCLLGLSQRLHAAYWSPSKCLEEAGHFTPSLMCPADTDPDPPHTHTHSACKPWLHFAIPTQGKASAPHPLTPLQSSLLETFSTHPVPLSWSECRRPPSLSAGVAGASPQAQADPRVGTEDSLVRPSLTLPSSFPTSTFGLAPCSHLPVKSRMLPPTSLD